MVNPLSLVISHSFFLLENLPLTRFSRTSWRSIFCVISLIILLFEDVWKLLGNHEIFLKKLRVYRVFTLIYLTVLVISLWTNILYRNREPTLSLQKDIVLCTTGFIFLIYVNGMYQAVKSNLFLYADDSCLIYQRRDIEEIEKQPMIWKIFATGSLTIH